MPESVKKERIISPLVTEPADRLWSNCLRVGEVVYISGLTSRAQDQVTIEGENEYEQSKIIFEKIKLLIATAGGVMDDIVMMTIYVTAIQNNKKVWKAREEYFSGNFPSCTLVEVSALATPAILVEINAVAHLGCSSLTTVQ